MRKGVFGLNANKDPDQPAEIYSLIMNFDILVICYVLQYSVTISEQ